MNEKPLMKKQRITNLLIFAAIFGCVSLFLPSCQSPETNKWTPPKFVKEWDVKEPEPGFSHQIISMTASNNGVFVLVKASETRYLPPKIAKVNEMTEKQRKIFLDEYVTCLLTGSAIARMTKEEKDEIIDFILKHFIPPRETEKMAEDEKKEIIGLVNRYREEKEPESNKKFFRERLQREGKDVIINDISKCIASIRRDREEIEHYRVQQYDFEGNFIKQWPENEKVFKEPIKLLSDADSNIYIADYKSNEITKFDAEGVLIKRLKIPAMNQVGDGFMFRGITFDKNSHFLILGQGDFVITPKLFEYDTNGRLIKSEELQSKIKVYYKLLKSQLPSVMKIERISDMAMDNDGNIYLLRYENVIENPAIIKLTPTWREETKFKVILKAGFEVSKIDQYERHLKGFSGRKFDSTQMSWIETGPGLYFPSSLFMDGKDLYVVFLGSKPFGVIDAAIYDPVGRMVGYWKEKNRTEMEWYRKLEPNAEVVDTGLSVAGYGSSIFMGRTMEVRTGVFYVRNVIQKFMK